MTYYLAVSSPEHAVHNTTVAVAEAHTTQTTAKPAEGSGQAESGILGINGGAFVVQLITFIFVFVLLKKFAFDRITKILDERHKTIDDGVRMGIQMEEEKAKLDENVADIIRKARLEADEIIAASHKDSREVIREAEKSGQRKAEAMISDAELRIEEDAKQARNKLEKELVGLVSEATETIVGEKVDATRDAEIVAKAMKGRKK